jgi:hypothetical protein
LTIVDWFREAIDHYAVDAGVLIVLVVLTLAWNLLARGVTVLFVKIKVHGEWETEINRGGGFEKHEVAKLRQFVHRVWGHTKTTGTTSEETYSIQGIPLRETGFV